MKKIYVNDLVTMKLGDFRKLGEDLVYNHGTEATLTRKDDEYGTYVVVVERERKK